MSQTDTRETFAGWMILELMGHRRLAGYVAEQEIAGAAFLRIDVPGDDGAPSATQFYSAQAVYAMTPCTEETARQAARLGRPEPVSQWELRQIEPPKPRTETRPGGWASEDDIISEYDYSGPDSDDDDEGDGDKEMPL